jgi:hypothetical protein
MGDRKRRTRGPRLVTMIQPPGGWQAGASVQLLSGSHLKNTRNVTPNLPAPMLFVGVPGSRCCMKFSITQSALVMTCGMQKYGWSPVLVPLQISYVVFLHTPTPLSRRTCFRSRGDCVELSFSNPVCRFLCPCRDIVPSAALGRGSGRGDRGPEGIASRGVSICICC